MIALGQPLLWSHVDFNILSSAEAIEILDRAQSAPLYLKARVSGRRWDYVQFGTFREALQSRNPRICHLFRISAEPAHLHIILEGLVSPAPTLEYLSLTSRGGYRNGVNLLIPDSIFDGSAPRLTYNFATAKSVGSGLS